MKANTKIKIKLFLLNFIFELIVNSIILFIAFISDKIIEILLFYIVWRVFRFAYPKIFHCKLNTPLMSIVGCLFCSILCFMVATKLMFNISISIFSSVIVGICINYLLYKAQDYLELKKQVAKQTIDIYKMTEDELRAYARSRGLSEMIIDSLVLRVIHNYKWVEIQNERNYTKDGIRYHKEKINKTLGIKL